ncbi:DUF6612 family protein [Streptococcus dentasini]
MKKTLKILCTIAVSLSFLAACNTKDMDNKVYQEKMTVAKVIKKAKKANQDIETVHFDMVLSTHSSSGEKSQKMKADLDYGSQASKLQRARGVIRTKENGIENYQEFIMADKGSIYSRDSQAGSWSGGQQSFDNYNVDPDYFDFLDIVYSMKDDFKLKEGKNTYTLVLKSQNIDLVSLFSEELNLSLTGYSQGDMKKTFEVSFDKEDFYLTDFSMTMAYKKAPRRVNIKVKSTYSKWNKVKKSKFEAPDDILNDSGSVGDTEEIS